MPLQLRPDVTIVPLTLEHAPNMYRWMCDPNVSRNLGLRVQPSAERTAAWIDNALRDPSIQPFAVLLDERHIGNVVLDRIDPYLGSARLSVYIGEQVDRGAGAGSTAIYLGARAGFETLGLHKIWAIIHVRNYASINAFNKVGFSVEGVLRDEFWLEGRRVSVLYVGLLDDEFRRLNG